jgi:hypothetical protein
VPPPAQAIATAVHAARPWAIAATSSSYFDRSQGAWTVRARPLTSAAETRDEAVQRTGGGRITWTRIQAGQCMTRLHNLAAFVPSDAPSGPDPHIVYISARAAACTTGSIELSDVAAQLTVHQVSGRPLNALVRH